MRWNGGRGFGRRGGRVADGLKEALAVGTDKAVQTLSKSNGYFGDAAVKILLPQKLQTAAEVLKKAGYQKEVDDLILSMNQVGVSRSYKALTDRYTSMVPFGQVDSLDLDGYVTGKSLDGMFVKVGQEEAKIRTNPAARTTNLLQKVFAQ